MRHHFNDFAGCVQHDERPQDYFRLDYKEQLGGLSKRMKGGFAKIDLRCSIFLGEEVEGTYMAKLPLPIELEM